MTVASTIKPEIDRPHRQQVRGFPAQQHQADGEGERERDRRGDDQRAPEIAQEDPLQHEDQRDPHQHVVQHRVSGQMDQLRAVIDLFHVHAGRQDAGVVDLLHQRLDALDGRQAFGAAPHQHDALHDVVVVILPRDAEPRLVAHGDCRHVAHQHRRAVIGGQHGVGDVIGRVDQPDAAHHCCLWTEIHRLAADIDIGVVQRRQHLRNGQAVMQQLVLVDVDFIGLGLAAPAGDVDHARHRLEATLQHPVLDRFEVGHGVAGRPHHAIAQDLADRTFRRDLWHDVVRQRRQLR